MSFVCNTLPHAAVGCVNTHAIEELCAALWRLLSPLGICGPGFQYRGMRNQEKGRGVRGGSERNGQPFPPLYLPDPNPFSGHSYVLPSDN